MIKFLQLFLSLTILITLHEFGHFFFAKKFKCRVEKFYLFFDFLFPFAGLLNFSLFKKKIGDTEYGLGWFPFGGYVQIAGMVDEQMDKSIIESEPQPWELRSKPAWQRLLVMMGGIIVNVILGLLIFWMVLLVWGKETVPVNKLQYGIAVDSTAYKMGLRDGDQLLSVDKKPVNSLLKVPVIIVMNKARELEVKRNGQNVTIPISEENISQILKNLKHSPFISVRFPCEIDSFIPNGNAIKSNLKKGDHLIAINDVSVPFFNNFVTEVHKHKGQAIDITYIRNADTLKSRVQVDTSGSIGFYSASKKYVPIETQTFSFFGALGQSFKDGWENIVMQVKQFAVIFTVKDAHQQVGGFYSMYKQMNDTWIWRDFWMFTGFLSLVLAFMNFLPIPMLDGGYILFILIEMISGRKVPDKVIYYANYVGLFLILGLMIYANTDFLRN
ncbi:MAG: RIP metalloprotease RseP [Bacteroidetes bacterium]|nr:RIP metalloprotease RseP [Bacteroidota bacterium]